MKKTICTLSFLLFSISNIYAQKFYVENEQGQLIGYTVISKEDKNVAIIKGKKKYSDKTYIIPETVTYNSEVYTVTELGEKAFHECENVTKLVLPNTVRVIRDDAVQNCAFEDFVFPTSLEYIENNAFAWTLIDHCTYDIKNSLRKEYTIPFVDGKYTLYKWEKNVGLILQNRQTNELILLDKIKSILSNVESVKGVKFTNSLLRGAFCLSGVNMKTGLMTLTNDETKRTMVVKDKSEVLSKLEEMAENCFKPALKSVERTTGTVSNTAFEEIPTDSLYEFAFSDEILSATIGFTYLSDGIKYSIKNISNSSAKILWDDAAYVDYDGNSSALVNGDTRFINVEKSQKSSVIAKNSTKKGYMFPEDNIHGTDIRRLLPKNTTSIADKDLIILLPIQVGDTKYEYTLTFKVLFDDTIGKR